MVRPTLHLVLFCFALAGCGDSPRTGAIPGGVDGYDQVFDRLREFIEQEMDSKDLPAVSIALVDGDQTIWSEGFGTAALDGGRPATAESVYRVGSVSKLFTDLGVMQLVEAGQLDLDVGVGEYLTDLPDASPLASATLRQLTSHRSGLIREPPRGHYFDASGTSLEETVSSFSSSRAVYPPEERIKYSNAGIATVGRVLEVVAGTPFRAHLKSAVLEPLGMDHSSFERGGYGESELAEAEMWSYHGVTSQAPTFPLGMAPAGSMYSTVDDLASFIRSLFRIHAGETDGIVSPETLQAMWSPQFAEAGAGSGYGIGFSLSELDGARRVGHGGAIYGFATTLQALPDEGLGVVVVTNADVANTVVERIGEAALRMMRAARSGSPLSPPRVTGPVDPERARELDGRYEGESVAIEVMARDDELLLRRDDGPYVSRLRTLGGDTLIVDGRLSFGPTLVGLEGAVEFNGQRLSRVVTAKPAPARPAWSALVGEYGWDHNILYILERDGELRALIEWFFEYPLTEVSDDVFEFGTTGLYPGERLVFSRAPSGEVDGVSLEGLVFPRRDVGAVDGETFRIEPLRPVDELRIEAAGATPPEEEGEFRDSDLVELVTLDPSIKLDIRYAGTNNFMTARFYEEPRAFLQRPAAEAVARVHRALEPMGFGLLIHDGYRPWSVTKMFYDATPESQRVFVANPANGSRHNRGAAIDLTLFDRATGLPADMTGGYDEFSDRSYPDYPGGTSLQRWHRDLLRRTMEAEGFTVYEAEWWHFDFGDWREYALQNIPFDAIGG